ncbi:MAG: RNA 2',3'-cyclic phosphodiesterase [Hyphomonadaceae bacterium]
MSLRLFAALTLPDDVADRLIALQKGVPGARWRPRENLHLTLRFFGEVQEPVAEELDIALEHAARNTKPFSLRLTGAGAFGGADPHALIMRAEAHPQLLKLAADCERAARRTGLAPESRKFTPHVTLAYLARAELARVQAFERAHALFPAPPFMVAEMGLYSSWQKQNAPNLYRLEASYPLG